MTDNMRIILAKDMAEQFNPETMEWDNGIGRRTVWVSHSLRAADGDPDKPIVVRDKVKPVSLAEFIRNSDFTGGSGWSDLSPGNQASVLISYGYATEYPRSEG